MKCWDINDAPLIAPTGELGWGEYSRRHVIGGTQPHLGAVVDHITIGQGDPKVNRCPPSGVCRYQSSMHDRVIDSCCDQRSVCESNEPVALNGSVDKRLNDLVYFKACHNFTSLLSMSAPTQLRPLPGHRLGVSTTSKSRGRKPRPQRGNGKQHTHLAHVVRCSGWPTSDSHIGI